MWQKLGKELQIREHSALSIPKGLIATWRTVYTAIRTLHPAEQILQEASAAFDPRAYQGPEGALLSAGIPPEEDFEPIYATVPELPDPPDAEDLYQVMDGNEPDAPFTSGVTDLNKKPGKPDLYPPLTPIKALAASAPTAEHVLQTQRSRAISRSSVIDPPPFATSVTAAPPCKLSMMAQTPNEHVRALSECRREALRRGDVQLLQAFPVVYSPNKPARHEALPYELVKELRKSVKEYGLQSSYTMNLIVAISDSYVMAPCDWRALLRLLLSPAQYAVWDTEYRDFVTSQVMENITNAVTVGMDEFLGQGQYAMPQAQAQLTRVAFTQAGSLTLRALRQVPDASRRETSFAVILQGPQESYVSFLDRLQTAVQCQIDSEEAQHLLLFQLAIENANADCKKVLDPLRNKAKTLTELIKACQNVGSEQFKAEMLTDNGPAYVSQKIQLFLQDWGVRHTTGIPHSPTGQAIVERMHHTLKAMLDKQKRGSPLGMTPQERLYKATYVLNFLNLSDLFFTAVQRHFGRDTLEIIVSPLAHTIIALCGVGAV
uniref:Integrase catalytic domain-containing protein n=1 Tax=Pelusios castaneus TaxID=367368 RepID=A0A8C8SJB5_9SAUR